MAIERLMGKEMERRTEKGLGKEKRMAVVAWK